MGGKSWFERRNGQWPAVGAQPNNRRFGPFRAPREEEHQMGIGPRVRRCFGRYEVHIAEFYRSLWVDLGLFTRAVRRWFPDARNILEIGCGEGAVCQRMSKLFPKARITGIDIVPTVGRLFQGDSTRVTFVQKPIQEFAATHRNEYDLVLICDVLHHIPWPFHSAILRDGRSALRPDGVFVVKEWENRPNLICALSYLCETYLTGDRVRYGTAADWRRKIGDVFGINCIEHEQRFRPWPNNLAYFIRNR
jgi:2-polyprenyl-3-methyl-5-hydroxy-6-metoxy-1,4-benzoquinol methylase